MVEERSSTWPLLLTASCLLAASIAAPFFVEGLHSNGPMQKPVIEDSGATASLSEGATAGLSEGATAGLSSSASDIQRVTAAEQTGSDALVQQLPPADVAETVQPEQPEAETVQLEQTEAEPAEVAERVASQVVEPQPAEADAEALIGPLFAAEGTASEPADPPAAANEPAESDPLLAALAANWMRRLPTAVSNLRNSRSQAAPNDVQYADTAAAPTNDPAPEAEAAAPQSEKRDTWPEPTALLDQLRTLAGDEGSAKRWAEDAASHVRAIGHAIVAGSDEAPAIIRRLNNLATAGHELADSVADRPSARSLRRAAYAIKRRIDIWECVIRLDSPDLNKTIPIVLDAKKLAQSLNAIASITDGSAEGDAWRDYLMIGPLKEGLAATPAPNVEQLRKIAGGLLWKLSQSRLTADQYQFIISEPVAELRHELKHWAAEPISFADLLRDLERYEQTGLPSDARRLAMDCQSLAVSPMKSHRDLGDVIDLHYRNANFRLAVTEELINGLIPRQNVEYAAVRDTILDRPTHGKSLMATEAAVRMQPNPERISMVLVVAGEIQSVTTTDAGLAKFHNNSKAYYIVRKPLEVDLGGISLWPSEVKVYNESRLQGVETPIAGIPVIGRMVEGVARSQHDQHKPAANREVRRKVASKARERIDAEVHKQFSGVVDRFNQRVFDPLNSLTLDPQLIEAETTDQRFTMRVRLAGPDQLGSHTPRPQAPSDSLASVQLHQTVLNNGIQRLELAGRTFTLDELADHVAARLNCPPPWETNPDNKDVLITFAEENPVVVRCDDGRIEMTLSIRRLGKSPRSWSHFQIRAYYCPQIDGCSALLARDGVIQLIGTRLTIGSQIALRGVFSSVLSKDKPIILVNDPTIEREKLEGAEVSQFVIDDGWIGISLRKKPVLVDRRQTAPRR
ncbi:MAG: hypothetical protein GX594_13265 [Pirellulaceae bacterium]|nr:hypothetical protein [Pirellulaceae bacterium]